MKPEHERALRELRAELVSAGKRESARGVLQNVARGMKKVKQAEALDAALAEIEQATKWLPIESAPLDGTRVLLCPDHLGNPFVGRWVDELSGWTMPGVGGLSPTRWAPIPVGYKRDLGERAGREPGR